MAVNDARVAEDCLGGGRLDAKTLELVRLAALVAVGGAVPSYGAQADAAVNACATAAEIVDVLVGVVPSSGCPALSRRPRSWRWGMTPTMTTPVGG
jgi:4-carboxymuconolactone decarboxylase